ncbi:MAG: SDR family NAD(P)-dependent oxidoreductase [Betaproteobacteria bacterium]
MQQFKDKVAVITGAAGALGMALAARFAGEGMRLALADVDPAALAKTEKQLKAAGAQVVSLPVDVSQLADVKALAELALATWGGVHVMCNNAGVAPLGPVWEATSADWDWVLGVNLKGVINGVQVFTPLLLTQNEGHIVNTASVAGLVSPPGMGAYAVSKHAVVALSECLYHDLLQTKTAVRCSVLCPAYFPSGIADSERNRPVRLQDGDKKDSGKSLARQAQEAGLRRAVQSGKMSADDIARATLQAVIEERFWILTHPKILGAVRMRMEDVLAGRNPTDPLGVKG